MKKLLSLLILWLFCCGAGFYSGEIYTQTNAGGRTLATNVGGNGDGRNEFVSVVVYGTTAKFKAIAKADTYFRVKYAKDAELTESVGYATSTDDGLSVNDWDTVTATATNLEVGTTYYYAPQSSTDDSTWSEPYMPTGGYKHFKTPVAPGTSFKFLIIADAHIGSYGWPTMKTNDWGVFAQGLDTLVNNVNPDFISWMGDDTGGFFEWVYHVSAADCLEICLESCEDNLTGAEKTACDATCTSSSGETNPYASFPTACAELLLNKPDRATYGWESAEGYFDWVYADFGMVTNMFGVPQYFAPGNHERDFGNGFALDYAITGETQEECLSKEWGYPPATSATAVANANSTTSGFNAMRTKYLLSVPSAVCGGVEGRYGYVDWGDARIIFITPYPYRTQSASSDNACPYDLGATQTAWYKNAVNSFTGKWIFVMTHQTLKTKRNVSTTVDDAWHTFLVDGVPITCDKYTYGHGIVGRQDLNEDFPAQGCNNTELFDVLENSVADKFLMVGHAHGYARERWKNMYVYSCPTPGYIGFTDIDGTTHGWKDNYYHNLGFEEEYPWWMSSYDVATKWSNIVVEVSAKTVKIYVVDNNGNRMTQVPIDVYSKGSKLYKTGAAGNQ